MKIKFLESAPSNYSPSPILISGESSIEYPKKQFLSLKKGNEVLGIYEIRFEYNGSPFKQAEILNNILIVGQETHCYLFDFENNTLISVLKLSGYFGYIYIDKERVYVTDASGLYCLAQDGKIRWANKDLGIDGVIIHHFEDSKMYGSGEWDPPGGWEDFVIDKETGMKLKK